MNKRYIYKITSPINQVYIGQTKSPKVRSFKYSIGDCKYQRLLYASIVTYGWINHTFEIIYENNCSQEEIDEKEKFFIKIFKDLKISLNIASGGIHGNKGNIRFNLRSHKCYKYSLKGDLLQEYDSISEASRKNVGNIAKAISNKTFYAGGYLWIDEKLYKNNFIPKRLNGVIQLKKNGEFVKYYNSIKEASIQTGLNKTQISKCLRLKDNRKSTGGFFWVTEEYYNENKDKEIHKSNKLHRVQLSKRKSVIVKSENETLKFSCAKEASDYTSVPLYTIRDFLRKKRKFNLKKDIYNFSYESNL